MLAGIRDILIISTPLDILRFQELFKDSRELGINLSYAIQAEPKGIAQSFIIGEEFIGKDNVCLILGDNIFYGYNFRDLLQKASKLTKGALVFAYYVKYPERYGVVEFDNNKEVLRIKEKPKSTTSNWAVTGLYFYDNRVVNLAKKIKPSTRGELEITDINNIYLKDKELKVKLLGRGCAWLDTGTYDSLIDASMFIKTIEERQGLKIGCIEEVAYRMGYINKKSLQMLAKNITASYGDYLESILEYEK
jgi:glucose-1-phosphate thymidylyltransferase